MIKQTIRTEYFKSDVDDEHIDYVTELLTTLFEASDEGDVYIDENIKLDSNDIDGAWNIMTALNNARVREWVEKKS